MPYHPRPNKQVPLIPPDESRKLSGPFTVTIAWKGALVCCAIAYVLCILTTIAPLYKMVGIQTRLWISNAILQAAGWLHLPADLGLAPNHYFSQQQTSYLEFLLLMLFAFTISGLYALLLQRAGTQDDYMFAFCLIWLTILVSGCLYLFTPATFSDDVYSYANYGRLLSVHHVNPYVVSPSAYPQDPTYHLIAFRLYAFAAHLLNIWLVMTILRTMGRSARTIALGTLLYAWNPLVLLESSLGGHNDVFMLTFILLGLLFSVRAEHSGATRLRDAVPALVAFTLAALVKLTAIPIIVFFILRLFWNTYDTTASTAGTGKRDRAGRWRAALSIALFASMISFSIALVGYAPFWLGHSLQDIAASFSSQPTAHYQFNSILAAMKRMECAYHHRDCVDHGDRSHMVATAADHAHSRAGCTCLSGNFLAGNTLVPLLVRDRAGRSGCCVSARSTRPPRTRPLRPGINLFRFGLPELLLCQHRLDSPTLRHPLRSGVPCNV